MSAPTLVTLSLGAGVQSTTLALLAEVGELPKPDVAIFADTGWEPAAVYDHLDRLDAALSFPVLRVARAGGSLRDRALNHPTGRVALPVFTATRDGDGAPTVRECTRDYKLRPITHQVRELLGYPGRRRVPTDVYAEQWIGFSTDEVGRVSGKADAPFLRPRYPLLELDMSRADCIRWLKVRGWRSTPKSACIGCPFHGNRHWRDMRDTCQRCGHHRTQHFELFSGARGACEVSNPDNKYGHYLCACEQFEAPEWDDAVAFDRALRARGGPRAGLRGEPYLHRSLLPLDQAPIDRVTRREWSDRQVDIFDAIADQLAEDGDPDGCSPYGCRSGAPA